MRRENLTVEKDGFYGAYYPCLEVESHTTMIYMLGNSTTGFLVNMGVKWLQDFHLNVLVLAPEPKKQGFYDIEIKQFNHVFTYLRKQQQIKFGIAGGSATAMFAMLVASYYPAITLTLAFTPCDFVMEGYYRDGLDGAKERPSDHHSFAMYDGQALPYLPFAYRHPQYWKMIKKASRKTHNMISTIAMFEESEKRVPLTKEMMIQIENIKGTLILVGASDDCLWNTCKYIARMKQRLEKKQSTLVCKIFTYEYGTHFLFPQSMLKKGLSFFSDLVVFAFASGRKHYRQCKKSRIDVDVKIQAEIKTWIQSNI